MTTTWYLAICGEQRLRTYSEHNNKVCVSQNESPNFLTTELLLVSPDLCLLLYALQTQLDVIKLQEDGEFSYMKINAEGRLHIQRVCGDGNEQKLLVGANEERPC